MGPPPWFHPSGADIIVTYLMNKQKATPLRDDPIVTVDDAYSLHPDQLQEHLDGVTNRELFRVNEWYFYTIRSNNSSYSFTNGCYSEEKDKRVNHGKNQVGFKRTLRACFRGRAAQEIKTGWILREYRVSTNLLQTRSLPETAMVMCKLVRTLDPPSESSQGTSSGKRTFQIGKLKYTLLKDVYERSQGTGEPLERSREG